MGKPRITLTIKEGLKELAHSHGINISNLVESILETDVKLRQSGIAENKDDVIASLKLRIAKIGVELEEKIKEIEKLKKDRIEELENFNNQCFKDKNKLKEEIEELKAKLDKKPKECKREIITSSTW